MVTTKAATPIYASPAGLELFFDKLKNLNPPATVDAKWVKGLGVGFPDSIVAGMKFLGAVNKDGKPNELFGKLRLEGRPFREALASLVTAAYQPVMGQFAAFDKATAEDVNNAFRSSFGVGDPDRYVRPFVKLCELAGIALPAELGTATKSPPRRENTDVKLAAPRAKTSGLVDRRSANVEFSVHLNLDIPWAATKSEVVERLALVRDAMSEVKG